LNLIVWAAFGHGDTPEEVNLVNLEIMKAFMQEHSGFRIKEMIGPQTTEAGARRYTLENGAFLWSCSDGDYVKAKDLDLERLVQAPYILGITREICAQGLNRSCSPTFATTSRNCGRTPRLVGIDSFSRPNTPSARPPPGLTSSSGLRRRC